MLPLPTPRKRLGYMRSRAQWRSTWSPMSRPRWPLCTIFHLPVLHNIHLPFCRTVMTPGDGDLPPAAVIDLRHDRTPDVLAISRSVIRQPNQIPALVRTAIDAWTTRKALRLGRRLLGVGLS